MGKKNQTNNTEREHKNEIEENKIENTSAELYIVLNEHQINRTNLKVCL